jgi:hypothetical protein
MTRAHRADVARQSVKRWYTPKTVRPPRLRTPASVRRELLNVYHRMTSGHMPYRVGSASVRALEAVLSTFAADSRAELEALRNHVTELTERLDAERRR